MQVQHLIEQECYSFDYIKIFVSFKQTLFYSVNISLPDKCYASHRVGHPRRRILSDITLLVQVLLTTSSGSSVVISHQGYLLNI